MMWTRTMAEPATTDGLQAEVEALRARIRELEEGRHGLRARIEQSSRLLEVARFMGTETNLENLLSFTASQVTGALRADRCSIFLLDETRGEIWSKLLSKETREIRFPRGEGLAGHTIETGATLLIPDPYADARFNRTIDEKTGFRTRNLVCVPLKNVEGRTIGCFQVVNKLDGQFDRSDLDYLEAFGSQAAVAIDSAQLHEENQRVIAELVQAEAALRQKVHQLEIVFDLEKSLNEIDEFDRFVQHVIARAVDAVNGEAGFVILKEAAGALDLHAFRKRDGAEPERRKVAVEHMHPLMKKAMETGLPIMENDPASLAADSAELGAPVGVVPRSALVVPLVEREAGAGEHIDHIGALEIVNPQRGRFLEDDLQVLRVIGAQVTSAISRKRLLHEKERSQRLATIGTLSSTIIHDFKNPMAIVRGYAEILQRMELPKEKREHFCRIIVAEVDRCVNMTKELLYFARGEKNYQFQEIAVSKFIDDVALILEDETKRHDIRFERRLEYDGPVRLDTEKMKRVIFNLSNNAISVLKPGDSFAIECRQKDGTVELRIRDSGPGIPPEIRARLFSPFVTHGKKDGTGLGLAIAKDIVEHHGGRIYLDEEQGPGACFVIELGRPEAAPTNT